MGSGDDHGADEADEKRTASGRLTELHHYYRQHPVTGPAGHSYIASESRPTVVHSAAPGNVDWDVVDHIANTVSEIGAFTQAANPEAAPAPAHVEAVYAWCVANTANAPEDVQQARDALVYRQSLEHAIRLGDVSVVCPHRCPACRTFGLLWRAPIQRALCTNRKCLNKDGLSNTWTLARLAREHVAAQKFLRVRAT